jgi:hypothetical protein
LEWNSAFYHAVRPYDAGSQSTHNSPVFPEVDFGVGAGLIVRRVGMQEVREIKLRGERTSAMILFLNSKFDPILPGLRFVSDHRDSVPSI